MGLEAGWNCHICLRSEHSTDAAPGTDASHGYASMLGSIKVESLPDLSCTSPQNLVGDGWKPESRWSPQHGVRCSSAPDVILFHSANDPQRKSVTSENRHSADLVAAAAAATAAACNWEMTDEDNVDQQMCLLLQQTKTDAALRHHQMSERSVSTHEPRRRSSSLRSASIADAQGRFVVSGRHADTASELEDERRRTLLEEDRLEKLNSDENADIDDESVASYVMSRRSSYTDSLPPGLGNRVCLYYNNYFFLSHCCSVEKMIKNMKWVTRWRNG